MPSWFRSKLTNEFTVERDLTSVLYATQGLLNRLISYTTSVLIMAKNLLHVLYPAAGLCIVATVTNIKNVVAVRGLRFTKNA